MRIQKSEPVQLVAKTHSYFPASFRWRGRRFDVVAVEKCWTTSGRAVRRLFSVRCQAGRFVLQQTVEGDHWQVTRWPLTLWLPRLRRSAPPQFPLPRHQRRPVARARMQSLPSAGQLAASSGAQPSRINLRCASGPYVLASDRGARSSEGDGVGAQERSMDGEPTTLVKVGWLWFDDDSKSSLEDKVARAAARYQVRFGRSPRLCYVHRGTVDEHGLTCGRLQLRGAGNVLPHHFLFVVDGDPVEPG